MYCLRHKQDPETGQAVFTKRVCRVGRVCRVCRVGWVEWVEWVWWVGWVGGSACSTAVVQASFACGYR